MVSRSRFFVKEHPQIKNEDLPLLPEKLRDLYDRLKKVLSLDPDNLVPPFTYHELHRELFGWRSIDNIVFLSVSYRLVYRFNDDPGVMRVDIASFGIHDNAYDKATERVYRQRY